MFCCLFNSIVFNCLFHQAKRAMELTGTLATPDGDQVRSRS